MAAISCQALDQLVPVKVYLSFTSDILWNLLSPFLGGGGYISGAFLLATTLAWGVRSQQPSHAIIAGAFAIAFCCINDSLRASRLRSTYVDHSWLSCRRSHGGIWASITAFDGSDS
mmetsp:Transcript_63691/g.139610  ORF Transcript_63691/g.139610 Transcript_63691/m.139610 type:complete len:116 (-) Transcript_63691:312-659(-)